MLEQSDRKKLDDYLDKIFQDLKDNIDSLKKNNQYSNSELIDKVTKTILNKLNPESKIILSSTYNMLESNTFKEDYFNDTTNKAKFYKSCILEKITKNVIFEIPKEKMENENSTIKIDKMGIAIAIIVICFIVGFIIKNFLFPIVIAALITFIMLYVLKKTAKNNIDTIIENYLTSVRQSLTTWIKSIESYYEERVEELKKED